MSTRRDWLARAGRVLVASAIDPTRGLDALTPASVRDDFPMAATRIYLNNAAVHPMSLSAQRAIETYMERRVRGSPPAPPAPTASPGLGVTANGIDERVRGLFAEMINAKPAEISYVPSTTAAENLIVAGLGLPKSGGNVVSDGLHFEGSTYLYRSLQAQGLDFRMAMPRDWRIRVEDMERLIDKNTKLVALSLVSYINGFQHDLKAICDLAHAHGAIVYADAVQAAGAIPIDVRATGIDCLASSSYKWLMGDFGLGFLYVREDLIDAVVHRTQYSFRQYSEFETHFLPGDTPAETPATWKPIAGVPGHFEVGTVSSTTAAALAHSLAFLKDYGVANVHAHNLALARRVQQALSRRYPPLTPPETTLQIVSFVVKDPETAERRLTQANVVVKVEGHMMRVSPSLYNDDADIDALLNALA